MAQRKHARFGLAAIAMLCVSASAALAHSFNLLLVVPDGEVIADDMRHAVLLAADERDGHPDNHSDGHLGGLDVFVTLTSDLADPDNWAEADPDIVVDPLLHPMVIYYDDLKWFALFGSQFSVLNRDAVLARAADPTLPPFAARFEQVTGRPPGDEAEAAYLGARLIDLIVRPLDDASDPVALRLQLEALR